MTHVRNLLRKLAIELYPTSRSDERTGESWDISMASGYLDAEDATSSLEIMRQLRSGLKVRLALIVLSSVTLMQTTFDNDLSLRVSTK